MSLSARRTAATATVPPVPTPVERVTGLVRQLPPARTLDVARGAGFLTRHRRGQALLDGQWFVAAAVSWS
jgi:hypothetical protein